MSYGFIPSKEFTMSSLYQRLSKYYFYKIVREDIRLYEPLAEKEHLCPFCDHEHSEFQLHTNTVLKGLWQTLDDDYDNGDYPEQDWSSFYMCGNCQTIINSVEWKHATQKEPSLLDNKDSNNRLSAYLEEHILLGAEEWVKSDICKTNCFFCTNKIDAKHWGQNILQSPVGVDNVGGQVLACWQCNEKIQNKHGLHITQVLTDVCVDSTCKERYPITIEEKNARKESKTLGTHLCPVCFYGIYKSWGIQRWLHLYCKECGVREPSPKKRWKITDRTQNPKYLDSSSQIICDDCDLALSFLFYYGVGIPTEYWLGVHQTRKGYVCDYYKCRSKGVLKDSYCVKTSGPYETVDIATIQGREQLYKMYQGIFNKT